MIDPSAFIHPKAHVEDSTVGARTKVWQFSSVIRGTVLGENCVVGSGAKIDGAKFGNRCIIGQNVSLSPGCVFGDDVFVGPGVVVCNDMWPSVKKDGFDIERFWHGFVTVGVDNGASIGAGAIILPGVHVAAGAVIAAGAVVGQNVPARMLHRRDNALVQLMPGDRQRMIEARA